VNNLDHDPLAAAFDEFRGQAGALVKPAGAARTREIMRTRKRNRNVAIAALSALVVGIPLVAEAVLTGDPHGHPADSTVVVPQTRTSSDSKTEIEIMPDAAAAAAPPAG